MQKEMSAGFEGSCHRTALFTKQTQHTDKSAFSSVYICLLMFRESSGGSKVHLMWSVNRLVL